MNIFKALCLVILAASFVSAQKAENERINLAQSGWTSVLFVNAVESAEKRSSTYLEDDSENVSVDLRTFLFNREKLLNFELCSKSGKTGGKVQTEYLADRFYIYEIKGRVFAYVFPNLTTLKIPQISEPLPKEVPTGCTDTGRSFVFMDEDGDGTFEQNCDRKSLTPLPQWVKDLGQIKIKTAVN